MQEPIDEQVLDLLVDGELPQDKQQSLLLKIDQEPGAWRRCALAFLEAQRWRREFGAIVKRVEMPSAPETPSVSPPPASSWNWRVTGTLLAMAASFLVAFGLGFELRRPAGVVDPEASSGSPSVSLAADAPLPTQENKPLDAVTLVVNDDGKPSEVQVPVVEGVVPDSQWLHAGPTGLPLDLLRALERQGHQVTQKRQFVPFQLEDGRQGLVPMDRVEITPVTNRSFQ
jgi:hypothetical protein